jgi:hypothetical protein
MNNKQRTYCFTSKKELFQEVKIHKGVNNAVNIIKNKDIPSIPKIPKAEQ